MISPESSVTLALRTGCPSSLMSAWQTTLSGTRMPTVFRFDIMLFGICLSLLAGRMNVYGPGISLFIRRNAGFDTTAYSLMWLRSEHMNEKGLLRSCRLIAYTRSIAEAWWMLHPSP
jgi:hypothetical protein